MQSFPFRFLRSDSNEVIVRYSWLGMELKTPGGIN